MDKHVKDNELYDVKSVIDWQIYQATKGNKTPIPYDELYQIGYMGYLKAQKNYDPTFGKMTLNYASIYIYQEIISALKKEYKYINNTAKPEINLGGNKEDQIKDSTAWLENQPDPNPQPKDIKIDIEKIQKVLPKLSLKDQEYIEMFYLSSNPKRLVDVAKERGVSKQRIHQIKERSLKNLRKLIDDEENKNED